MYSSLLSLSILLLLSLNASVDGAKGGPKSRNYRPKGPNVKEFPKSAGQATPLVHDNVSLNKNPQNNQTKESLERYLRDRISDNLNRPNDHPFHVIGNFIHLKHDSNQSNGNANQVVGSFLQVLSSNPDHKPVKDGLIIGKGMLPGNIKILGKPQVKILQRPKNTTEINAKTNVKSNDKADDPPQVKAVAKPIENITVPQVDVVNIKPPSASKRENVTEPKQLQGPPPVIPKVTGPKKKEHKASIEAKTPIQCREISCSPPPGNKNIVGEASSGNILKFEFEWLPSCLERAWIQDIISKFDKLKADSSPSRNFLSYPSVVQYILVHFLDDVRMKVIENIFALYAEVFSVLDTSKMSLEQLETSIIFFNKLFRECLEDWLKQNYRFSNVHPLIATRISQFMEIYMKIRLTYSHFSSNNTDFTPLEFSRLRGLDAIFNRSRKNEDVLISTFKYLQDNMREIMCSADSNYLQIQFNYLQIQFTNYRRLALVISYMCVLLGKDELSTKYSLLSSLDDLANWAALSPYENIEKSMQGMQISAPLTNRYAPVHHSNHNVRLIYPEVLARNLQGQYPPHIQDVDQYGHYGIPNGQYPGGYPYQFYSNPVSESGMTYQNQDNHYDPYAFPNNQPAGFPQHYDYNHYNHNGIQQGYYEPSYHQAQMYYH